MELRAARLDGRLADLATQPFHPRLPFTAPRDASRNWWNGFLYSHHQLTLLPEIMGYLSRCRYSHRHNRVYPSCRNRVLSSPSGHRSTAASPSWPRP
jgi:hypothetical protein